jgi:phage baseplate assembly protein V
MNAAQVWQRLRLMVAQGVATRIGASTVQATVLDDEQLLAIRVEPYGLSYRAKPGAEVYVVYPAGDRARGVALVIGDKRYQMDLAEGEVALHDDEGNYVKLGRGGVITAKSATSVIADTPLVRTTGDLIVEGKLQVIGHSELAGGATVAGALTNNGTSVGNGHTHTTNGIGAPTSAVRA